MKKKSTFSDIPESETSASDSITSKMLTQLLLHLEPPTIAEARPPILHSVSSTSLREFVSAFRNYSLVGGTRSALSFLHSDVILYFQTVLAVDLSVLDSDSVISQFRSTYAPTQSEYISLLSDLAMQSTTPDTFDKGAVDDYSMHFFAFLSDNPDIKSFLEEERLVECYFSGILPPTLRKQCKSHRLKTMKRAISLLSDRLEEFSNHQRISTFEASLTSRSHKKSFPTPSAEVKALSSVSATSDSARISIDSGASNNFINPQIPLTDFRKTAPVSVVKWPIGASRHKCFFERLPRFIQPFIQE